MSRIGKRILKIKDNLNLSLDDDKLIVKGPKGELELIIPKGLTVQIEDQTVKVLRKNDNLKALHGVINSLINNMIIGVSDGFTKNLEIVGVGYRFYLKDKTLTINAGFSHPVLIQIPDNLEIEGISNNEIIIKGIDKQAVGELAAKIRKVRPPEPYKGKGIRYKGEFIRRKEGKKASKM